MKFRKKEESEESILEMREKEGEEDKRV